MGLLQHVFSPTLTLHSQEETTVHAWMGSVILNPLEQSSLELSLKVFLSGLFSAALSKVQPCSPDQQNAGDVFPRE